LTRTLVEEDFSSLDSKLHQKGPNLSPAGRTYSFIDSDSGGTPDPRRCDGAALEWQGNVTGRSV
jgi:hypothetical protein